MAAAAAARPRSSGELTSEHLRRTTRDSLDSSFSALTGGGGGAYAGAVGSDPLAARRISSPTRGVSQAARLYRSPTKRPLPMLEMSLLARGVLDDVQGHVLSRCSLGADAAAGSDGSGDSAEDEIPGESKTERVLRLHGAKLEKKRARLQAQKQVKEERYQKELAAKAKVRAKAKLEREAAHKVAVAKREARAAAVEEEKTAALRGAMGNHARGYIKRELDSARWEQKWRAKHYAQLAEGPKVRESYVDREIRYRQGMPAPGAHDIVEKPTGGLFGKIGDQDPKSTIDWVIHNAEQLPGPADYTPGPTVYGVEGSQVPAPKFAEGAEKSALDWVIYNAKELPSPAEYSPEKLRSGNLGFVFSTSDVPNFVDIEMTRCAMLPSAAEYTPQPGSNAEQAVEGFTSTCKFSEARPKSDVDKSILRYKYEPGPAEYGGAFGPTWVRQFSTSSTKVGGGAPSLNVAKAKTNLEWVAYRQSKLPGPADSTLPEPPHHEKLKLAAQARRQAIAEQRQASMQAEASESSYPGGVRMSRSAGDLGPRTEAELTRSFESSFAVPAS